MSPVDARTRRLLGFATALVFAVISGAIWWTVGYTAFLAPTNDTAVGGLLFVLAILGGQAGLVSPFIVMVYLGQYTKNAAQATLLKAAGILLMPIIVVLFAYFGVFEALGIREPLHAFAYFNALFGIVLGGIIGHKLTHRLLRKRGITGSWAEQF